MSSSNFVSRYGKNMQLIYRSIKALDNLSLPTSIIAIRRKLTTSRNPQQYDIVVVGGGIIGTATARELLLRHPSIKVAILEKEQTLGAHQSGHNSGVIHAGIYYTPGSLKAKLCVKGLNLAYKYCDEHQIPYKKCGKLIVALNKEEVPRLDALYERGQKNGVKDLKLVDSKTIKEIEPNCQGLKAIWSPNTGIVDWVEVNKSYGKECEKRGATIHLGFCVSGFDAVAEGHKSSTIEQYPVHVKGKNKSVHCKYVVTCGGLFSDKLAELSGCSPDPRIVPFRGEYLLLKPEKCDLVKANIYPVPDPQFPFLGVHFTPRMDGSVWLGPNAVLAFKREGYHITDIDLSDMWDAVKFRGLRKLAVKHLAYGLQEMYKGINITAQVRQLQKYVPQLQRNDITRGPSGVRAQALDKDGKLVDDFVFDSGKSVLSQRILHVRNAPSPGATSSLAIAEMIADKVQEKFSL